MIEAIVSVAAVLMVPVGLLVVFVVLGGFFIVQPRTHVVVLRFGVYTHTITEEGIRWVFPVGRRILRISSQVVSLDLPRLMVLEANGNPIEVSAVCSYQVREAHRAVLEIENFNEYVSLLATAVVKNVCSHYPYESTDPQVACLKKESDLVTQHLIRELQELALPAGLEILQVRLNDLTYAPEIAQSMLLRQQALAMVDARRTIVEGAVETVVDAARRMHSSGLSLDAAHEQALVTNLLVVLCSGEKVETVMPLDLAPMKGVA